MKNLSSLLLLGTAAIFSAGATDCTRDGGLSAFLYITYATDVALPDCAVPSATTFIIDQFSDWTQINSPGYRLFCVRPGNYAAAGKIKITASGTSSAPRVVRYFDPVGDSHTTHPVRNDDAHRAFLPMLQFVDARHWVVDGLTMRDATAVGIYLLRSQNIVLNRLLLERGASELVAISEGSHNNTVQNSVLRRNHILTGDNNCMNIFSSVPGGVARGNRLVANEIYDCTDGIQLVVLESTQGSKYPGTVIADNDVYITPSRYTDCNGRFTTTGVCAAAEVGIELKAGSSAGDVPVRVENNRLWGFRKTDGVVGGGGGWGGGISLCCFPTSYALIRNNIIFDVPRGIEMSLADHISVVDNIVHKSHNIYGSNGGIGMMLYGNYLEVYRNVVVDAAQHYTTFKGAGIDYRCNAHLSGTTPAMGGTTERLIADYNSYYDSAPLTLPGTHDVSFASVSSAANEQLCYWRKRWTGPEKICVPDAVPTSASPHYDSCDPLLGSRLSVGIDNVLY